jgi:hypothetical protein
VKEGEKLDDIILKELPEGYKIRTFEANNYGIYNCGCGIIEQYLQIQEDLKEYDWIIHYEPRQKFLDNRFFSFMVDNGVSNIFSERGCSFYTGLFCIDKKIWLEYIKGSDMPKMVECKISIEDDLYIFMQKYQYKNLEKMGVLWKDYYCSSEEILF